MQISKKYKGMCCSILAALFFAGMTACVHLSGDLPSFQKALFRNLPALAMTSVVMARRHISPRVAKGNRLSMFGRCAAGTAGLLMNFYAIDRMVLADANMLNKLSPFFAILFSYFILKEKLKLPQMLGVAAAFCGALLIIKPTGAGLPLLPAVAGTLGGLGAGLAYTFVRKMGENGEIGTRIIFYFSLFSCVVTTPYFFLAGKPMSLRQFLILMLAGVFGAGGQVFITRAYFYAPARELSVYDYTQVLFATLWGYFLFGQVPDVLSFLGYAVIIGAAVIMFFYNNQSGPFRPKAN